MHNRNQDACSEENKILLRTLSLLLILRLATVGDNKDVAQIAQLLGTLFYAFYETYRLDSIRKLEQQIERQKSTIHMLEQQLSQQQATQLKDGKDTDPHQHKGSDARHESKRHAPSGALSLVGMIADRPNIKDKKLHMMHHDQTKNNPSASAPKSHRSHVRTVVLTETRQITNVVHKAPKGRMPNLFRSVPYGRSFSAFVAQSEKRNRKRCS